MDGCHAFKGKNVLVTGAGGYIGRYLAKAIAACDPASLTLLDHSEQNLFELRRALQAGFPGASHQFVVGSVTDAKLLDWLLSESPKHLVFHAAAFKHVELMELNPFAAVSNNVVGTFTLAKEALRSGCEAFVLISTDKAVQPHSIMGVSKGLAELITVSLSRSDCRMNAIRLCNIMGSSGSVIPIFQEQIEKGKPLTLTHPDASRYFMPVEDAVAAILAAATYPTEGRILLPPFGPAVRIADLARSLRAGRTVPPFDVIGLRPGEKVHEDLIGPHEITEQAVDGEFTVLKPRRLSAIECERLIQRLEKCVAERSASELLETLVSIVPEYRPSLLMRDLASMAAHA